jgi:hypothetical protein
VAVTPEGAVKNMVKDALNPLRDKGKLYYFMPVQGGFGASTLDFLGCHIGRFFAIETKAPGKTMTDRQTMIAASMVNAGAKLFVIEDYRGVQMLYAWLNCLIE